MSIYDYASVGPYVRFRPNFGEAIESVLVFVEYNKDSHDEPGDWEQCGSFAVPLGTWEEFQHYARSVHG